jgi:hypothetical protein
MCDDEKKCSPFLTLSLIHTHTHTHTSFLSLSSHQADEKTLQLALKALGANGKLVLCTADASTPSESVMDAALFGGFSAPQVSGCAVVATRPSWDLGATDQVEQKQTGVKPPAVSAWTLDGDDLVEEEFIDDADLLSPEDLAKPAKRTCVVLFVSSCVYVGVVWCWVVSVVLGCHVC